MTDRDITEYERLLVADVEWLEERLAAIEQFGGTGTDLCEPERRVLNALLQRTRTELDRRYPYRRLALVGA